MNDIERAGERASFPDGSLQGDCTPLDNFCKLRKFRAKAGNCLRYLSGKAFIIRIADGKTSAGTTDRKEAAIWER